MSRIGDPIPIGTGVTQTSVIYRLVRFGVLGLGAISFAAAAALIWFEIMAMRPLVSHARTLLEKAAHSELDPPEPLTRMLSLSFTENSSVACRAMSLVVRHHEFGAGMKTLNRQLTEVVACLLGSWHFSPKEMNALVFPQFYMGPSVSGYAQVSIQYVGVPLDQVDLRQAAKLVAMAHAPNLYLDSPERLNRRVDLLMSRDWAAR
jgi:hypothetical protein